MVAARRALVPVLRTIYRRVPINASSSDDEMLHSVRGEIEIRDVVFAYPTAPCKVVCDGYSLQIEAGQVHIYSYIMYTDIYRDEMWSSPTQRRRARLCATATLSKSRRDR